ncbi:MAG: hypothetical protein EOP59_11790, partial [Sphingomonadales bacterium]
MSYHAANPPRRDTLDPPGGHSARRLLDRVRELFMPFARSGLTAARDPVGLARAISAARRQRGELIDADLFAEPAWDLLLELYVATREGTELPMSSASLAVGVPVSVSLRWIKELETRGLVARRTTDEANRELIGLTQKGVQKME